MAKEYKQQNSVQHKCPNCGAALKYDPATGNLHCEHCDGVVEFEKKTDVSERSFEELATFKMWNDSDIACFRCSNCGAESVTPRTALATTCPFCGSPVVISDVTGSIVKPDTVIPFELTQKQAAEQLEDWRKHKLYAPNKFRKHTHEDAVKGVFVPAWTFDAQTSTAYKGTVGYHRTRTVRRNGKTFTETYTEWRRISGVKDVDFDDILVKGNDNVTESDFKSLQPYPQSKYRVFDDEYLAGYIADHYTLEPNKAFERAKEQMRREIRQKILAQYHADVEGELKLDIKFLSKSFKYVLLPVYVASVRYNNKLYNQYVSGVFCDRERKKSRVCGKAPVSPWKVLLTVLVALGAVAALVWLLVKASHASDDIEWLFQWNKAAKFLLK